MTDTTMVIKPIGFERISAPPDSSMDLEDQKMTLSLHLDCLSKPKRSETPARVCLREQAGYMAVRHAEWAESEFVPLHHMSHLAMVAFYNAAGVWLSQYTERENDPGITDGCLVRRGRYDMRVRRVDQPRGLWFQQDEIELIAQGLLIYNAVSDNWHARRPAQTSADIPPLYAVFESRIQPDVNHTPIQRIAVAAAKELYHTPLPSTIARQMLTVQYVRRHPDKGRTVIGFCEEDAEDIVLPFASILRPGVEVGTRLQPGAVIADPLPTGRYQSWDQLCSAVGQKSADMFLEAVFQTEGVEALGGFAYPAVMIPDLLDRLDREECSLVRRFSKPDVHPWPQCVRFDNHVNGLSFMSTDGTPVQMIPQIS